MISCIAKADMGASNKNAGISIEIRVELLNRLGGSSSMAHHEASGSAMLIGRCEHETTIRKHSKKVSRYGTEGTRKTKVENLYTQDVSTKLIKHEVERS